ncbi:MAG: D-inositol-3-phosphate glycosyltransferase [Candidatus Kaiserbacteria bacterium GW2011_GWB1_50_17]|uniref:D-inositol-3-phosphate glycosyltransferase n=1 Tax=Candidatus Kaiserbacteria bacterium GW2011_GWB1_50_17 TaxID=1618673 RepID=A0A0G1ZEW6_9BACT|nr:MAG: D-inositol-3-phosphate glycosyltransferase [Candidatus Kaiserbacteria bacterium GW2011_GWB1_50_17]
MILAFSNLTQAILFLGRLDPIKNADVFVEALELLSDDGVGFTADIYGGPTHGNEKYAQAIRNKVASPILNGHVRMHVGITHSHTPDIYRSHALYVNLTPSGSFDKTIGEAMASGLVVIVANESLRGVIADEFIALTLSEKRRSEIAKKSRVYILNEHSLPLLVQKLECVLFS